MTTPYIFTMIFYCAFAIYIVLGNYILWLNPRSNINRIFYVSCLSISVWAFCFSVANSAADYETSLVWRRIASVGWGSAYSVFLHFFILLTERKKVLKSKVLYLLLYIPVLVNIYVFGISEKAPIYYNLQQLPGGWINIPVNNAGDIYFNIYYVSYSIISLILIGQWGRKTKDINKKKQSRLLLGTFAAAFVLGSLTDIIVNSYAGVSIPQMSPLIMLIPVLAVFYSIRKYGLMRPVDRNQIAEPGKILNEINLFKIYNIISMVFIVGSMVNFIFRYYFKHEPIIIVLIFSGIIFTIGNILQAVLHISMSSRYRDAIFVGAISLSIPIIIISFAKYGSVTVWSVPIIFILISVIFNRRSMMFWLGLSIMVSQIIVWLISPNKLVHIDWIDYSIRIMLFCVTLWIGRYVNRIYINRLVENEEQISYLRMVSHVSADFIKVNNSNLDDKINYLLEESGRCFNINRCSFYKFGDTKDTIFLAHEWCKEGVLASGHKTIELTQDEPYEWVEHINNNEMVYICDNVLDSGVAVPVMNKGDILGFIWYESLKDIKEWRVEQKKILIILANLLADAITKVEAEKEISYLAYYDALTGLPNRTLFKNRLEHFMHLARRTETLIAVMFINLDSFKSVNDSLGHEGGDELLKHIGVRLSKSIRGHDTVARFGGDEFLIKINQISKVEDIRVLADKIIGCFNKPVIIEEQEFFIKASMGISVFPQDGESSEMLIKNANLAMYISKEKGKNQYTLCSPTIKDDVIRRMKLTNSLYRAKEREELAVHYQPQVNVSSEEIVGFEALIRWKHQDLGMVSPGQFIPLAEQTGLINSIGQWVLETACIQNKQWQIMGLPKKRVAVNLSVEQFRNPNLVSFIADTLNNTGLAPQYLELEITESIALEEPEYIIKILNELKDLGVTIAIDDFGTEYSSLSRLKELPVDRIKIAMQFIHGITESKSKDRAIAKIIIQLAKSLDLNVIAEGVETQAQIEFLRKHLCDEIQGFYYYRPMPAKEIEKILE